MCDLGLCGGGESTCCRREGGGESQLAAGTMLVCEKGVAGRVRQHTAGPCLCV